jgi:putative ABC transport system ATP-binding protein
MLKLSNIRKIFSHRHGKVTALNDINLEIADGEFLSITGPSGSGKSTLLLALGGMSSPNEGKVLWNNESIFDWELKQRAQWRAKTIGFVFQTFNLIPYLTVYENVNLAMDLSDPQNEKNETILSILDRMKLSNRLDHLPSELSIGQQQRVALARALVKDPQVILADEPTGNLDPETAEEILNIFKEVNHEGKTVVLITHDPRIAQMTKRNVRIVDGRIAS